VKKGRRGLWEEFGFGLTTNSETSKRRIVGESLDTHGLGWNHLYDSSITCFELAFHFFPPFLSFFESRHGLGRSTMPCIKRTRFDELGSVLNRFTSTTINLLQDLRELAGDVSSMAIKNWSITSTDLTRVVKDDDLSVERLSSLGRVVLGVTGDVTTTDFLD
jgi:hypothetical protein